jgi:CheY-like chemotaxis protein
MTCRSRGLECSSVLNQQNGLAMVTGNPPPVQTLSRPYLTIMAKEVEKIILLVEDSDDDAALFLRALARSKCEATLHRVTAVEEAIECILEGMRPRLIFLDLLLPNVRGVHFLRWIREQKDCKCIPVVVLAGVVPEPTLRELCDLGVNAVMLKPSNLSILNEGVSTACIFWLRLCVPPGGSDNN